MTDNEIIKALECCTDNDINSCGKCPIKIECYTETIDCKKEALDIINRQKAEIKRLNGVIKNFKATKERQKTEIERRISILDKMIDNAAREIVKEMAGAESG